MNASVWLLLGSLLYTLQLRSGSFPKPLTEEEERHYLALSAQGDLEARNILVERNLRLVAHDLALREGQLHAGQGLVHALTQGTADGPEHMAVVGQNIPPFH